MINSSVRTFFLPSNIKETDAPNPAGVQRPFIIWFVLRLRENFFLRDSAKDIRFIDQVCSVTMAEYWLSSFFFRVYVPKRSRGPQTRRIKERGQYAAILAFGEIFLAGYTANSSEWAKYFQLTMQKR